MFKRFIPFLMIIAQVIFCVSIVATTNENSLSVVDVKIPHQYGVVHEHHQAANKLVIHIQDNHTNYGAQKNLAQILEYLNTNYNITLACVEGAAGIINTTEFSRFPDTDTKEVVSDYFLKNGKIDGSEYISIVRNSQNQNEPLFSLHGIETPALYNANIISYKRAEQGHRRLKNLFCNVSVGIDELKKNIYSEKLAKFDSQVSRFLTNQNVFLDYCVRLARTADDNLVDYGKLTNFSTLISLSKMETEIDFQKADSERTKILNVLIEYLNAEQSESLFKQELRFKTNIVPPLKYHIYLTDLIKNNGIDSEGYPDFIKFCDYLKLYDSLDNSAIMQEEKNLRNKVYDALIRSSKEREIYEISQYLILINHLTTITISQAEMKTLKKINHSSILKNITALLPDIDVNTPEIVAELHNYELFYSAAGQRENELVNNTLNVMEHNSQTAAVLIAGGYHSDGIKKLLADKNISYVVITPNAVHGEKSIPYFSLLSNYMTPLEQVMAPQVSSLKIASWLASESLADPVLKATLSQKMKLLFTSTLLNTYIQRELKKYPLSIRLALKDQIQSTVKSAINQALQIAEYDHLISVESINFIGNRIVAEIAVTDPQTQVSDTIFVDYSSDSDKDNIDSKTQDTFLEIVKLIDGSVQSFINYKGYSKYVKQINGVQISILDMLTKNSYSLEKIISELEYDIYSINLTSEDISGLLDNMLEAGLIEKDKNDNYTLAQELVPRYISFVMINAFKKDGLIQLRPKKIPSDMRLLTDYLNKKLNYVTIDFSLELKEIQRALSAVIIELYENNEGNWQTIALLRTRLSKIPNVDVLVSSDKKQLAVKIASTEPVKPQKSTKLPTAEEIRLKKEKNIWIKAGQGDAEAISKLVTLYHALALDTAKSRHTLAYAKRARIISKGDIDHEGYLALLQTLNEPRTEDDIDNIIAEFESFTEFVQEQVRIGIARFYADDTLKANLHYTSSRLTDLDATYRNSGKPKEDTIMRSLDPLFEPELIDLEARIEREEREDAVLSQQRSILDNMLSNIVSAEQRDILKVYLSADTHREGINAVKEAFNVDTEYITNTINTLIKANEVFLNYDRMQSYLPLLEKKEQEVFALFKEGKINARQLADAMGIDEDEASEYLKNIVFKFHYYDLLGRLRNNENFEFLQSFLNFNLMQPYLPFLEKKEQEVLELLRNDKLDVHQLADAMGVDENEASEYLKNIVFKFQYFNLLGRLRNNENFEFLRSFLLPQYADQIQPGLTADQLKQIFDALLFEDKFLLFTTFDQGLKPVALSNILPFAEVSIRQRMRIAISSFNKAASLFQPNKEYKPFEFADYRKKPCVQRNISIHI